MPDLKTVGAVTLILAIVGIWIVAQTGTLKVSSPEEILQTASSTGALKSAPTSTPTSTAPVVKKDTGGSHLGLTYGEAVEIYANRRVQFDAQCAMIPSMISVRNGTSIMFDNRSEGSRYFYLDRDKYLLRGYDFRILKLSQTRLPHTVVVDCGSGRNTGKIILN